jgi:hypothetical protein
MKKSYHNNDAKKLFWLIVILILLMGAGLIYRYFFYNPIESNINTTTQPKFIFDDQAYKKTTHDFFARLSVDKPTEATAIKDTLLTLKVSQDFKDLHYRLVMACLALEDYGQTNDGKALARAQTLLTSLAKDYPWLVKENF